MREVLIINRKNIILILWIVMIIFLLLGISFVITGLVVENNLEIFGFIMFFISFMMLLFISTSDFWFALYYEKHYFKSKKQIMKEMDDLNIEYNINDSKSELKRKIVEYEKNIK